MPKPFPQPEIIEAPQVQTGGRGPTPPPHGGRPRDDWDKWPQGSRGPRERLERYRLLLAFVMVAIFFFFISLTSVYSIRQHTRVIDAETGQYISNWQPIVIPPLLWINTLLLVISS